MRVNGEEYGKVELRKGDHIDLGHVRLRFVAPGEDFVFDRDAQVVDVGGGKKSRVGLVLALVLALLVLGGGAVWLITHTGKPGEGGGTGKTGDSEAQVAKLLLDAAKSMKSEDWESAIARPRPIPIAIPRPSTITIVIMIPDRDRASVSGS